MDKKEPFDTNTRQAIDAMAKALAHTFKDFSRHTREKAWKRLVSPDGLKEVNKLLQDPNRPINGFAKLRENATSFAIFLAERET
jgi:hypothetical protein